MTLSQASPLCEMASSSFTILKRQQNRCNMIIQWCEMNAIVHMNNIKSLKSIELPHNESIQ